MNSLLFFLLKEIEIMNLINIINKLKIITKNIYAFECRFAQKHDMNEIPFVKSCLGKMKRECETTWI